MPLANSWSPHAADWVQALADVAAGDCGRARASCTAGLAGNAASEQAIAKSLLGGERKAILLGNAAAHHAKHPACWRWPTGSAHKTGATVGYLSEAANTGRCASWSARMPGAGGQNAARMLRRGLKAAAAAQRRARVRCR